MIPLVLLPGMMCDARLYGPQMAVLSGRWPIMLSPIVAHDTIAALAAEVLSHAPPRFALAGLSMGGIVAMEVLRQAPDRVTRLALLDTNPLAEAEEIRLRRGPQIARALDGGLADVMRDEMKPNYLSEGPDKRAILDLCMDMALALGPEVFARQSRALAGRRDQTDTLRAFRGPTLIMMGEDDRLCPRDRHDMMHSLVVESRLVVVRDAAHLPTLEKPHETTAELIRWLEE
jgi:pimeloyl-ACP methyl ester carboxylesterase